LRIIYVDSLITDQDPCRAGGIAFRRQLR
jgi:hypothetical protein